MNVVDVLSRFIHVSTAITLVGGTIFMLFVLHPAAKQLSTDEHDRLRGLINTSWKKIIHVGIVLFLISGFYNYMQAIPKHVGDKLYHPLLGTKILIALVIFFIASALVGRSAKFEFMRRNRPKWMMVVVLLAAIVVAISSFAKVRGTPTAPTISQSGVAN